MVLHIAGSACCLGVVTLLLTESCRPHEAAFCVGRGGTGREVAQVGIYASTSPNSVFSPKHLYLW